MPNKGKVLVIDDNLDAVEVLKRALTENEYEVITSFSGEEGLNMALSEKPDCVLLDVMMPGMSGFHICKTLKRDMGLALPVVILSAKSSAKDISYAKSMGADDYLTKPVSSRRLVAAIDAAITAGAQAHGIMAGMAQYTLVLASNNVKTIYQLRQLVEGLSAAGTRKHRLIQAESAMRAERVTKAEMIDLIIVDGHLPAEGASVLCRSIKTDPKRKKIPIIALMPSANDDIKYAWAEDRLTEPIDTTALVAAIKRHLGES